MNTGYFLDYETTSKPKQNQLLDRLQLVLKEQLDLQAIHQGSEIDDIKLSNGFGPKHLRFQSFIKSASKLAQQSKAPLFTAIPGIHSSYYIPHEGSAAAAQLRRQSGFLERKSIVKAEKHSLEHAKFILPPSEMIYSELEQAHGALSDRARVLYPGFDSKVYCPSAQGKAALREQLDIPANTRLVLYYSDTFVDAEVDLLMRFLQLTEHILKNSEDTVSLAVCGNDHASRIKPLIKKLPLSNHTYFLNESTPSALCLQAADVYLYLKSYDPFAQSCLHALACGCPVITGPENGAAEVIRHCENGFILGDDSIDTRREAVSWWLRTQHQQEAIATSIEHLSMEQERKIWKALLEA